MNLPTIEMPEEAAKQALDEYQTILRPAPKARLDEARRDYEEMDRALVQGYKQLAKGNALVNVNEAFSAAGVKTIEATWSRYNAKTGDIDDVTGTVIAPALAMTRADARTCWCVPMLNGSAFELHANDWHGTRAKKADRVVISAGTFGGADEYGSRGLEVPSTSVQWRVQLRAIVPTIPPALRPPNKLSGYHVLWEAEWAQQLAVVPRDPALLRHLGGDLYAVLAVWDLSEVERAVLGGMRSS